MRILGEETSRSACCTTSEPVSAIFLRLPGLAPDRRGSKEGDHPAIYIIASDRCEIRRAWLWGSLVLAPIINSRVSAVERRSNALLYSWASLRWAQLLGKPSLMSATLCSTFSVARLTLSSCPTRARPIEQTTQLSAYKLNRFSKELGSLQKHLICAYPSNRHSQKSEWHSMNVPLGRHPNELHMVVTPRKFWCAGGES